MKPSNAVWRGKCPRCHKGDIFKYPFSKISKFASMNSQCPQCGASFTPEPGFYFGALFVSYAFNVALLVAVSIILYLFIKPPDWVYGVSLIVASILSIPFIFRYSRILFLYWFGGLQAK
jgi:uncharacterized protein (DUF983 family)